MTLRITLKLGNRQIGEIPDKIIITFLFAIALITRTYKLGEFPYFPPEWPYLGDKPWAPGMYGDEANYLKYAIKLFEKPTTYQPWLQLLLVHLSTRILGTTTFAARLPSAIFSSLNTPLIYLTAKKLFNNKPAAIISALYYTAMTPALIYNRMLFLENGVAFFFLLAYISLLLYEERKNKIWLYLAIIASILAVSCKINGFIAPIYVAIYTIKNREHYYNTKKIVSLLFGFTAIILLAILGLRIIYAGDYLKVLTTFFKPWWIGMIGREMSIWQYLIFESMPSGALISLFPGYFRLEYWYLISYFCIAYLASKELCKVKNILTALILFIAIISMVWGVGSYYIVIIQPFMAIPVGYALTKMTDMNSYTNLAFTSLIYMPLIATIVPFLPGTATKLPAIDYTRYAYKLALIGTPLALSIANIANLVHIRKTLNILIIISTLTALLAGSYLLNVLYPQYFSVELQ